jgi:CxxC motif-containing protein (DUF1111 family)
MRPNAVSMLVTPVDSRYAPTYAKAHRAGQGVVPEPVYGGQFQDMAVPGVAPEGKVRVEYTPVPIRFKDGTEVELRKPSIEHHPTGLRPDASRHAFLGARRPANDWPGPA